MAQKISQGSIFGRIGSGVGRGLADQLPKEIERGRLSAGLKNFEQESGNLSPMQNLSRLASIPGALDHPQLIDAFSKLSRFENQKNAYANRNSQRLQGTRPSQEQSFADLSGAQPFNGQQQLDQTIPSGRISSSGTVDNRQRTPNVRSEERTPGIVNTIPLNEAALTRLPWTPEQRDERISDYIGRGFLADEAKQLALDDEARDLSEPGALQKRDVELEAKSKKAKDEFQRQLETRLQKTGEGVYQDITGDMLLNMQKGLERDLRSDPKLTFEQAANDWSNRALEMAKAKNQFSKLANTTGIESIINGDKALNKLKSYQNIFKRAGNSEEYFNLLKSEMGLSPQGAAIVAFPPTKKLSEYVNRFKPIESVYGKTGGLINPAKIEQNSRKAAIDIEKLIDSDDSILSIARALSEKDPSFDQEYFFNQLREDQDILRLNARQRLELAEGSKDITPTWGDIKILPWFRRSTK